MFFLIDQIPTRGPKHLLSTTSSLHDEYHNAMSKSSKWAFWGSIEWTPDRIIVFREIYLPFVPLIKILFSSEYYWSCAFNHYSWHRLALENFVWKAVENCNHIFLPRYLLLAFLYQLFKDIITPQTFSWAVLYSISNIIILYKELPLLLLSCIF